MNWRGTVSTEITSWVFWAVSATIAEVPCTPAAANAFRSAWIPAPPPESDVAMVSALGITCTPFAGMTRIRFDGCVLSPHGHPGLPSLAATHAPAAAEDVRLRHGRRAGF